MVARAVHVSNLSFTWHGTAQHSKQQRVVAATSYNKREGVIVIVIVNRNIRKYNDGWEEGGLRTCKNKTTLKSPEHVLPYLTTPRHFHSLLRRLRLPVLLLLLAVVLLIICGCTLDVEH